jgi:hypothetical protein
MKINSYDGTGNQLAASFVGCVIGVEATEISLRWKHLLTNSLRGICLCTDWRLIERLNCFALLASPECIDIVLKLHVFDLINSFNRT